MTKRLKCIISMVLVATTMILCLSFAINSQKVEEFTLSNQVTAVNYSARSNENSMPIKTSSDGPTPYIYGESTDSWYFNGVDISAFVDPVDEWGNDDYCIFEFTASSNEIGYNCWVMTYNKKDVLLSETSKTYVSGSNARAVVNFNGKSVSRIVVKYTFIVDGEECFPVEKHFNKIGIA